MAVNDDGGCGPGHCGAGGGFGGGGGGVGGGGAIEEENRKQKLDDLDDR